MATAFFGSSERAAPSQIFRSAETRSLVGQSPLPETAPRVHQSTNHFLRLTAYCSLLHCRAIHQGEDMPPFRVVAECVEVADLIEAARPVERIQIMGVTSR
jgi:hypothetical protein